MPHIIYKYEIPNTDEFELELPTNSKILNADCQNGTGYLWVLHDPKQRKEKRTFVIIATGQYFKYTPELTHIGTYQQPPYVWHLFERTN